MVHVNPRGNNVAIVSDQDQACVRTSQIHWREDHSVSWPVSSVTDDKLCRLDHQWWPKTTGSGFRVLHLSLLRLERHMEMTQARKHHFFFNKKRVKPKNSWNDTEPMICTFGCQRCECAMENTNKKGHGCLRDILAARQGFIVLGKNPGLFVLGEPTHDRQVPETGGSTC